MVTITCLGCGKSQDFCLGLSYCVYCGGVGTLEKKLLLAKLSL